MSANAPPTRSTAPRSAIRAKHRPGLGPGSAVSAARRSADVSRWRGTHAGTAKGSPKSPALRRAPSRVGRRLREMVNPRDVYKRECWYRRRSSAAILVGQVAQPVPRGLAELRLPSLALEAGPAQLERRAALCLGDDAMKPTFVQRSQSDAFARSDLADFAQQRIRNLHGRLHVTLRYGSRYMGTH